MHSPPKCSSGVLHGSEPLPGRIGYDFLIDGAEDRVSLCVLHLDADAVAEPQIGRGGLAIADGLDCALLRQAGIAEATFRDRFARPAILVAIGDCAGAKDGSSTERAGFARMHDQRREIERHVYRTHWP